MQTRAIPAATDEAFSLLRRLRMDVVGSGNAFENLSNSPLAGTAVRAPRVHQQCLGLARSQSLLIHQDVHTLQTIGGEAGSSLRRPR